MLCPGPQRVTRRARYGGEQHSSLVLRQSPVCSFNHQEMTIMTVAYVELSAEQLFVLFNVLEA